MNDKKHLELKLCPFCGEKAKLFKVPTTIILYSSGQEMPFTNSTGKYYGVKCPNNCAQTMCFNTKEQIIEEWNQGLIKVSPSAVKVKKRILEIFEEIEKFEDIRKMKEEN